MSKSHASKSFTNFIYHENAGVQPFWELNAEAGTVVPDGDGPQRRQPSRAYSMGSIPVADPSSTPSFSRVESAFQTGPFRVAEMAQAHRVDALLRRYLLDKHLPSAQQVDELMNFMATRYSSDAGDAAAASGVQDARSFLVGKGWVDVGPAKVGEHEAKKAEKVAALYVKMLRTVKAAPPGSETALTYVDIGCGNGITTSFISAQKKRTPTASI